MLARRRAHLRLGSPCITNAETTSHSPRANMPTTTVHSKNTPPGLEASWASAPL